MITITVVMITALSVAPVMAQPRLDAAQPYATKDGNCPAGYYRSGSFCTPLNKDSRPAVARPPGGSCPSGWYASGSGCVRLNR
jgi:hypothetical protein